ncbi:MAG: TIGR00268 family protein, partial [Treponema sp.]|nr:TIGR00268 family protein [Treponema sp.]
QGIHAVLDGSNLDDLGDYRPGLKALEELHIISPLREAGMTKDDIRQLSRRFDLPTWDKPAFACLASRIPYGERIDKDKLARIEKAEDALRAAGFRQFRVRSHGDIARIEVAPGERRRFFDEQTLDSISRSLKCCGFLYVAFELEGYTMGNMNRILAKAGA